MDHSKVFLCQQCLFEASLQRRDRDTDIWQQPPTGLKLRNLPLHSLRCKHSTETNVGCSSPCCISGLFYGTSQHMKELWFQVDGICCNVCTNILLACIGVMLIKADLTHNVTLQEWVGVYWNWTISINSHSHIKALWYGPFSMLALLNLM